MKENKAKKHLSLAKTYINSNTILAQKYIDSCLFFLENNTNIQLQAQANLLGSQILIKQHQHEKAYSLANAAFSYFKNTGNVHELASIHFVIGSYLSVNNLFNEALDEFWQSSLYFEKAKDVENFVLARNSVGKCLYSLNRKDEAKTYFNFVKIYAETHKDSMMLFMSFKNLADVHENQPEQAIVFYKNSISLGYKIELYEELASLYIDLARTYEELDAIDSAVHYLSIPLDAFNVLRNKDKQHILLNLALLHSKSNNIDSANFFMNKLKNISETYDDIRLEEDVHKLESNLYSQQNNYKDAFYQLLEAYKINDSINKASFNQSLNEIKEKYYYKQKAKLTEISHIEKENQVKQEKIKTLYFAFFSVFLVFMIIMGLFNAYKQRKLNRSLNHKNIHINQNNIKLKNTINTRDRLISVIAHDIKNPLGAISGFAELLLMNNEKPDKVKNYAGIIYKSATNLNNLLENLLSWARSQTQQVVINPTEFNLHKMVKSTLNLLDVAADERNIKLVNNCKNDHYIIADSNTVQTIIRNITSNAIKFSDDETEIKISSEIKDNFIAISIQDSGVGMSKDDVLKLFKQDIDRETIGNHENKGTGVGLLLCHEFASLNKGYITVQSTLGKGSTFTVNLPYSRN